MEVVEAERRVVLGGGGAAVGCAGAAHAQALLAPLQVIGGRPRQISPVTLSTPVLNPRFLN